MCLLLHNSTWLAKTLSLSPTTIKKLRKETPQALPPFIKIGRSYRYDQDVVMTWLKDNSNNLNLTTKDKQNEF